MARHNLNFYYEFKSFFRFDLSCVFQNIYSIKISSFKSNLRLKIKRKFAKKSLIKLKNK